MKRNQTNPLTEAAQFSPILQATEVAGAELARLIDFIEYHNPDIDRATATLVAAYYLKQMPAILLNHPEMMQQLRAIADNFSKS